MFLKSPNEPYRKDVLVYSTPNQNSMPGYVNELGFKEASAFVVRSASRLSLSAFLKPQRPSGLCCPAAGQRPVCHSQADETLYLLPHSV